MSGFDSIRRSRNFRTPSMMLCSIFSFPWALRRRNPILAIIASVAHQITLIPGDGIGPEVADATVRAVNATGVEIEWERVDAGVKAEKETGKFLPEAVFTSLD